MSATTCTSVPEAIAGADAYLFHQAMPTYSDLLDLFQEMADNPDNVIQEDAEIRGILYAAGRG